MLDPSIDSGGIPVPDAVPVLQHRPVTLAVPGRPRDLELTVAAPAEGDALPVIVFSHGHGPSSFTGSMYGYRPLIDFWAAHGFAVVIPNHLDAVFLGLRDEGTAEAPLYLRARADDLRQVLDRLGEIEAAVPSLAGRLDRERVAAVGHSAGGGTINLVSGATTVDEDDGSRYGGVEERFAARVIMCAPGVGDDLDGEFRDSYVSLKGMEFSGMTPRALVVTGEKDAHPFFSSRSTWRSDAYTRSPGPKANLMMVGAEHMLGGVSGYDAAETSDEDPERVAVVRAMIRAWLRSELYEGDDSWSSAVAALDALPTPPGRVSSR